MDDFLRAEYNELIGMYMDEADLYERAYEIMGRLLDPNIGQKILNRFKTQNIYIYGGGYIGIQLYKTLKNQLDITVVDKSGNLKYPIDGVKIVNVDLMRKDYVNEKVIITPINYLDEIYEELIKFVPLDNIIIIGELIDL